MRISDLVRATVKAAGRDGNTVATVNAAVSRGDGDGTRVSARSRRRIVQRNGRTVVDESSSTQTKDAE
jgi:hypothetical protein